VILRKVFRSVYHIRLEMAKIEKLQLVTEGWAWNHMVRGGVIGSSIVIILFISIYYLYFKNQLEIATAYGTILSAIASLFLVVVTWRYLTEVHKQVNLMADAEVSSKTRERNRDLSDVMTKLVAPLYFRKSNEDLFGKIQKRYREKQYYNLDVKVYFDFWDPIEKNMHLASPLLFSALEEYRNAKEQYWDALEKHANMFNVFEESPEGKVITRRFEDARSELSLQIGHDYKDIRGKLRPRLIDRAEESPDKK